MMKIHCSRLIIILLGVIFSIHATAQVTFQNGDLVFVGLKADSNANPQEDSMAQAITAATGKGSNVEYIHAAIVELDASGKAWIIDATTRNGVSRHSVESMFKEFRHRDGTYPLFEVMRLADGAIQGDKAVMAGIVARAKEHIGEEYNFLFVPTPGKHYCTELVYDCYLRPDGGHIFETVLMNFKDASGEFPPYWVKLFASMGVPIPQDQSGTNPQQIHDSAALISVGFLIP